MKIANIEYLTVHPGWRKNLIFVRVETDDGIVGWGESYSQYDRDGAVCAQLKEMSRYLIGRDPFQIRHMGQMLYDDYAQRRNSLEFLCAWSGIEQALWDIAGKVTGQPVYNLLGGPVRKKIRVYANGWSYLMRGPDDFARAAEKVVEMGYTALKFDPLPRPWRTYIPKSHVREARATVKAIRDAVGPDVDILIELHRRLAPVHAIEVAQAIEEFDPYWLEEPCLVENIEGLAEVRAKTTIPVVTGEAAYGRAGFRPVFRARAVDYINPDVANTGGILELTNIASWAESEMIGCSPHNYNSTTLGLSSTVQASAVMGNFLITEYFLPFEEFGAKIAKNPLKPVNGYIELPESPGLGIEMNEEAIRANAGKPFPLRNLPFPEDEGP